jgi:hypothetical protein
MFATSLHQPPPATAPIQAAPDYARYNYGHASATKVVDIATQPTAIFTSESLFHNRISSWQTDTFDYAPPKPYLARQVAL